MGIGGPKRSGGNKVVVLLRVRERKRGIESGVGMEVFRDSLWSDSDMGTHSRP